IVAAFSKVYVVVLKEDVLVDDSRRFARHEAVIPARLRHDLDAVVDMDRHVALGYEGPRDLQSNMNGAARRARQAQVVVELAGVGGGQPEERHALRVLREKSRELPPRQPRIRIKRAER